MSHRQLYDMFATSSRRINLLIIISKSYDAHVSVYRNAVTGNKCQSLPDGWRCFLHLGKVRKQYMRTSFFPVILLSRPGFLLARLSRWIIDWCTWYFYGSSINYVDAGDACIVSSLLSNRFPPPPPPPPLFNIPRMHNWYSLCRLM